MFAVLLPDDLYKASWNEWLLSSLHVHRKYAEEADVSC